MARYDPDGSPDTTFGSAGKVLTPVERGNGGYGLALHTDEKIVVGGAALFVIHMVMATGAGLARYHINGSLDATFGKAGKLIHNIGMQLPINCSVAVRREDCGCGFVCKSR